MDVELLAAVSSIPGTEASEPTPARTVPNTAKLVVLTVPENAACAVGSFDLWPDEYGRPRTPMQLGDTIRVWIIDYRHLDMINWVEAETRPNVGSDVEQEIEDIVASIELPG